VEEEEEDGSGAPLTPSPWASASSGGVGRAGKRKGGGRPFFLPEESRR
jgi:hypothetical protein